MIVIGASLATVSASGRALTRAGQATRAPGASAYVGPSQTRVTWSREGAKADGSKPSSWVTIGSPSSIALAAMSASASLTTTLRGRDPRLRLRRLAPLAPLVAVALDLARQVLGHQVDGVDHVVRALAGA